MRRAAIAAAIGAALVAGAPRSADAFCGFYVSGAGADLFNNATLVVMMRSGTRTVLSMQNSYKGPTEDFAMVVPVPVVLQKENVKTLPPEIFARVDKLAAPRLVEYWETDPCEPEIDYSDVKFSVQESGAPDPESGGGVTVEAQFKVAEYDIVILSARDATALETWLRKEKYKIPAGAEPFLRPYVEAGSKFFVAKVDASKVKFKDGQAMLSPLRFHYDSQDFSLPIRLGMINSEGTQDLIVHILAPGQRYEVANYKNATIPTNLDLTDEAKTRFGEFYAALFDRTLEKNPQSVITEYAWDASSCDPCPEPALDWGELATLGGDVIEGGAQGGFVLTRLHARYAKGGISEDLVFKEAAPIVGGREFLSDGDKLEEGSRPGGINNFQGRYAIRHKWEGKVDCEKPIYGRWGGPPGGAQPGPIPATELAFVDRGKLTLASVVTTAVPEIDLEPGGGGGAKPPQPSAGATPPQPKKKACGCQSGAGGGGTALMLLFALGLSLRWRRRRAV